MKRLVFALVLLVFVLSVPAFAQYQVDDRDKFALRVSVFRPTDGNLKEVSSTWLGPVVDWYLSYDELDRPTKYVSLGLYTEDKKFSSTRTTKLRIAPLTYNIVRRFSEESNHWYAGAGAGVYMLKYKQETFSGDYSDSSMKLGVNLIGGRTFSEHYFTELQYNWAPKWLGSNWSGISLHLGMRTSF